MSEASPPGGRPAEWILRRLDILTLLAFIAVIIFIAVWFQIISGM